MEENLMSKKRPREEESSNNNINNINNHQEMDSFLASMTFAGTGAHLQRGGCDCDECGGITGGMLPQAIIDAIRAHKKLQAETVPLKRTQQRELLQRKDSLCVYRLTLPLDSQPLVEFGSTHRLVWIQKLSPHSKLWSIGKGIVGSQDEENARQPLNDWKQGDVFLVPSNGGKAIAWIHTTTTAATTTTTATTPGGKDSTTDPTSPIPQEKQETPSSSSGHAVLIICKIPKDAVVTDGNTTTAPDETNQPSAQDWPPIVANTCAVALHKFTSDNTQNNNDNGMQYQKLSQAMADPLREALSRLFE
jgi:hypothetical protein